MRLVSQVPNRLRSAPRLAMVYLQLSNCHANGRNFQFWSAGLIIFSAGVVGLVLRYSDTAAAQLNNLRQHDTTVSVLAGIITIIVVSHLRKVRSEEAARSWLTALPTGNRVGLIEKLVLQLGPVVAALFLISGLALLCGAALAVAGINAQVCAIIWRSLLVGAMLGSAGGLVIPLPRPEIPYPGSRYVPNWSTRGRHPLPSLAALAAWPIRRMFAMLRPKMLSRTLLPLLLMLPMGTDAASAMILISLLGGITALACLLMSIRRVGNEARMWLNPTPMPSHRLRYAVMARSFAVMIGICAALAWLVWVGLP